MFALAKASQVGYPTRGGCSEIGLPKWHQSTSYLRVVFPLSLVYEPNTSILVLLRGVLDKQMSDLLFVFVFVKQMTKQQIPRVACGRMATVKPRHEVEPLVQVKGLFPTRGTPMWVRLARPKRGSPFQVYRQGPRDRESCHHPSGKGGRL